MFNKKIIIMATIKSYTSMKQSKVLAEILPIESADMYYFDVKGFPHCIPVCKQDDFTLRDTDIPCWSLAALLSVLPTIDDRNAEFCKDIRFNKWHIYYHGTATLPIIDTERCRNLVDACYIMIIKLHGLKQL